MTHNLILALLVLVPSDLPAHETNAILRDVVDQGLAVGEVRVKLAAPAFSDDQTAEQQHAALVKVAGSSRGAEEMLRDSVSAPHKLRTTDVKAEGAVIRTVELEFIVRDLDLDALKPEEMFDKLGGEPVEVANMRYEVNVLKAADLKDSAEAPTLADHERLIHTRGRLLDRIAVESTDRIAMSRSKESLVFASRSDPKFGTEGRFPNRWATITLKATGDVLGPPKPYAGTIGYVKMTRLKGLENAVVVEARLAFAEPLAWFDGAPILRSKFGLIAQDQVRRLRRELRKSNPGK
jgi:hypothetical protein